MTQLLYKGHPSLRAVQIEFYSKGGVAQKENHSHQKRWAFLMAMIEEIFVIMIAGRSS